MIQSLQFAVTSTSANISGMPPADNADDVMKYFNGRLDLIIDGGKTPGGMPSTIVAVRDKQITILRKGAVSEEEILRPTNPDKP